MIEKVLHLVLSDNFSRPSSFDDFRIVLDFSVDLINLQWHHKMVSLTENYPIQKMISSSL